MKLILYLPENKCCNVVFGDIVFEVNEFVVNFKNTEVEIVFYGNLRKS